MNTAQTPTVRPSTRPDAGPIHTPAHAPAHNPAHTPAPHPAPPAPVPERPVVNHSDLLTHLYDPDNHTLRLCDLHHLSVHQLADELFSDQIIRVLETARRIAELRLTLIRAEAELAAWARLHDLAANFPTTPRDRETARKAASQILRDLRANKKSSPVAERGGGGPEAQRRGRGKDDQDAPDTTTPPPQRAPSGSEGMASTNQATRSSPVAERGGGGGPEAQRRGRGNDDQDAPDTTPPHQPPTPHHLPLLSETPKRGCGGCLPRIREAQTRPATAEAWGTCSQRAPSGSEGMAHANQVTTHQTTPPRTTRPPTG